MEWEQLREQVEHLLQEKSSLTGAKRALERENEQLHEILAYYEHMAVDNANDRELQEQGWEEATTVVSVPGEGMGNDGQELAVVVETDGSSPFKLSPFETPLLGSSGSLTSSLPSSPLPVEEGMGNVEEGKGEGGEGGRVGGVEGEGGNVEEDRRVSVEENGLVRKELTVEAVEDGDTRELRSSTLA